MKRFLGAILLAMALASPALAQNGVPFSPQIIPPGTVMGRLPGFGPGPVEAIPFSSIPFSGVTGPSVTTIGHFALWNTTNGTLLQDASVAAAAALIDGPGYNVVRDGADPTDTLDSSAVFNTDFAAAAASGGSVAIPCGTYLLAASPITATIAAGKTMAVLGSGIFCTSLDIRNQSGPQFLYGSQFSGLVFRDMALLTNEVGLPYIGLYLNQTVGNANPAFSGRTVIDNVAFLGDDAYTTNVDYWGIGIDDTGVSNVSARIEYHGAGTSGNAVDFSGNAAYGVEATVFNLNDSLITDCGVGFYGGDYEQGISLNNPNITGCAYGFNQIASPTAPLLLTEVQVVGGQIAVTTCAICTQDPNMAGLLITNVGIAVVANGGIGIQINGSQYAVNGNSISGPTIATVLPATSLVASTSYIILSCYGTSSTHTTACPLGQTDFTAIGAGSNTLGLTFTASGPASGGSGMATVPNSAGTDEGIIIASAPSFQQGGMISSNRLTDFSKAIVVAANVNTEAQILNNGIFADLAEYEAGAVNYSIGSGSTNTVIVDNNLNQVGTSLPGVNVLPTCGLPIAYSQFLDIDSQTATFNATVTGGSTDVGPVVCSSLSSTYAYRYH